MERTSRTRFVSSLALVCALLAGACSSSSGPAAPTDAGTDVGPNDGGLRAFTSPGTTAGDGEILVTASGEVLALGGYPFPPAANVSAAFVDGWEVRFTHLIATFDHVRLWENPDLSPIDPTQVGALVAQNDGPWAVDLHLGGPVPGAGGAGEQAVPITIVANQNLKSGAPSFDTSLRYAFGFDVITATGGAYDVNLDAEGRALYPQMIAKGYSVLYVGTATFRGGTSCTTQSTTYDFSKLPKVVNFALGFKSPTSYVNCQNPDLQGAAFPGEESQRGVQPSANTYVRAQMTLHTDHPFWESVVHDAPLHFDQLAGRHVGVDTADVVLEDLVGVDPTYVTDANGTPIPWRSCTSGYPDKSGVLAFDVQNLPLNPSAAPGKAIRDLYDFVVYDQSTQGHLNSDGLCAVVRNYPSPH
jgi:hypothetical protein